ncbi:MAG: glycosyltransferase family 4 protein [Prochlorococcus marinus XMU1422]|nr:glycosyltransferase family 4 protein [Prochlorococcus marinus XMU1421]MBO7013254.1 glycosyltransferase family 4 protein [Prochlorococcus marinus XMU1422]MCR8542291.1 glycosyltransferase [Prochlorococcus marinus XMU1423]
MFKKKILYILFRADYGGAEQSIPSLIDLYNEIGYETNLIILSPGGDENIKKILFKFKVNLWRTLIMCFFQKNKYDFIISSIPYSSIPATILSLLLKPKKLLIWLHNSRYSSFHTLLLKIPKFFYETTYLADSDKVKKEFEYLKPKYAPIYFHSINNMKSSLINKNKFITLARPSIQKGLDLLAISAHKFPNINFFIYGCKLIDFKNLYPKIKLSKNIKFIGYRKKDEIFTERCFYIQPSRWEGFCISIVEAILYGCIPIGSAVGEITNHLENDNLLIIDNISAKGIENKIRNLIYETDFSLLEKKAISINKGVLIKYNKNSIKRIWNNIFEI